MSQAQYGDHREQRGLTLIEVMVTVVVVALIGIGILTGISYGIYAQRRIHELNGATRVAAEVIDQQKRQSFRDLAAVVNEQVTIYDNETPETTDDTLGNMNLRFYMVQLAVNDVYTTEVGRAGTPAIPVEDLPLLQAEVTVSWNPAGADNNESVVMSTMLAP